MPAWISPPTHIPLILRFGLWIARRTTGRDLLPARLMAWYPRAAIGSGVLEALAAHREGRLDERLLKLVRIQASLIAACPFCIDMNAFEYERYHITSFELEALQGRHELCAVASFSSLERVAIEYARRISETPPDFSKEFIEQLLSTFCESEIVVLASTAAQVNYWARLIQALGVPPAGFNEHCELLQRPLP